MASNTTVNQWAEAVRNWLSHVTVSQHYGCVSGPGAQYEPVIGGCHFHQGVDLAYPAGTPALNVLPWGRVEFTGRLGGYGNAVIVGFANGTRALYGHLRSITVTPGQGVALGQQIGVTGGVPGEPGAGASTGAHLHLELRNARGQTINPGGLEGGLGTGIFDRLSNMFSYLTRPYNGQGWPAEQGGTIAGSWYPGGGTYPVADPTASGGQSTSGGGTSGGGGTTLDEKAKLYGCGDRPQVPPLENEPDYIRWSLCIATRGTVGKVEEGTGGLPNLLGGASGGLPFGLTLPGMTFVLLGGVLLIAGLRSLTNEPAVRVITQPVADVAGAGKGALSKLAAAGAGGK
jgi:hypothetical protein